MRDSMTRDSRTLAELKKILEIEGLLDTYSHFFDDDDAIERKGYPRNNYSGLNSPAGKVEEQALERKITIGRTSPEWEWPGRQSAALAG